MVLTASDAVSSERQTVRSHQAGKLPMTLIIKTPMSSRC
jgi:hypothetical protein